jgi:branched-chain amino acid transport system permease protein
MFLQLLVGALMIGAIYGLIGLTNSLIYRASAMLNFAQGEFLMAGAFIGLIFFRDFGIPYPITMALCLVLTLFSGFIMERIIIRPILKKGGGGMQVVLVTIGLSIALQNFAMIAWYSDVQSFPSIFGVHYIDFGLVRVAPESLLSAVLALIFMIALQFFMTKTRIGTSMRAAAQIPSAASVCGINVSFTKGLSWGISIMLVAVAGILLGPVYGVQAGMGSITGVKGFAAAVIGGFGNMWGAVVGGFILGLVETFAAGYIASDMKDFISFLVLILFMIIKPTGLFNAKIIEE